MPLRSSLSYPPLYHLRRIPRTTTTKNEMTLFRVFSIPAQTLSLAFANSAEVWTARTPKKNQTNRLVTQSTQA